MVKTLGREQEARKLRERLSDVRPEDARVWGTMSAGEMMCHLRGAFLMAAGVQEVEAVPSLLPRGIRKVCALRVPLRWPHGVPTIPELERAAPLAVSHGFAADREAALAAMDRFLAQQRGSRRHPIFGRMTDWDWMRWGYLHTDHHLRQFGR